MEEHSYCCDCKVKECYCLAPVELPGDICWDCQAGYHSMNEPEYEEGNNDA